MHRINDEAEFRGPQAVPIYERVERVEIRSADVERAKQIFTRRKRGNAVAEHFFEFRFHLRDDRGGGRTAVTRLELHAIPLKWIVAGADLIPRQRRAGGRAAKLRA